MSSKKIPYRDQMKSYMLCKWFPEDDNEEELQTKKGEEE